ncbi:hypothetical protein BWQ96_02127 [Gracilariopsis chorda]|uniref:Uncharacterized protein n=1 Tax=Gracilariopsis chorda TaxID=448386 RepID=A0A2V3J1H4_9FLOR|nr:hypothetical protein BWQ96_02127 [Gracilariopsis chorda]|eukprot:PXF48175.1 hypothetical protein BWQ96_02127 [Gracilariopsis chorda]
MFAFTPFHSPALSSKRTYGTVSARVCAARPFHICRSKPNPRFFAAASGWAETRLKIPHLRTNTRSHPDLPGVCFEQAPLITTDDLFKIIRGETPDEWVNEIVRTLLGWQQLDDGSWNDDQVKSAWKEIYPDGPPDFIGSVDDYSPARDRPVKIAMQRLTRSIPPDYKQSIREILGPLGFRGWKVEELTPNRTRRATAVNWILYWYRVHHPDYQWS